MTHEERMAKAIEFNKAMASTKVAGQIATRDMIRTDELQPEEMDLLVGIYYSWESKIGMPVVTGDILSYNNKLYEVIQGHDAQAGWTPDITPALFKAKAPEAVVPEWVQPTGAQDAYNIGDKVIFEGTIYESTIDANTWSPTDYPQGWKLI